MPLPDSFFQPKDKTTDQREFPAPEPVEPDDIISFPDALLDDDGKVPANSILRQKTVVRETYFRPAELIGIDSNTNCVIYRISFEARQFIRVYLIHGIQEILISDRPAGVYSIQRYIQECPGGRISVTPWHVNPALGPDTHEQQPDPNQPPSLDQSEELLRREEGDDGHNPPPSTGDLDKGPDSTGGIWFWQPPELYLRLLFSHGFTEREKEGNHHILREGIWQLEPPVRIEGCWIIATYRAAIRTTRWLISNGRRVGTPQIEPIEPPMRVERRWRIPRCDDSKPINYPENEQLGLEV